MNVSLRPLEDRDLDAIYQQVTDPESIRMAAFTAEGQTDRRVFEYWRKLGFDASESTAISHPVAVRRSRKRSCASTEVGTECDAEVTDRLVSCGLSCTQGRQACTQL
jgi:hypothetical protein